MANYAVIDNGTVINTIVADSIEVAEEVTGKTCVAYTDEDPISISWYWNADVNAYIPPSPYASWIYNSEAKIWNAPTPRPEENKHYNWNEETTSWVEVA